jgi:hypothetical protein
MYILIDRERMAFLHKNESVDSLANVAWIECHNASYCIFPLLDATGFRDFTDMELGILYRNITGKNHHNLNRPQLLQVIFDLCSRIPESDIDPFESDRQAESIKEGDERRWLYVRGAFRPAQKADLFKPECKTAEQSEAEETNARSGKLPALQRKDAALKPSTGGTGAAATVVNAQQPARAQNGPKRGTAKAIIWSVADKMWEASGKPTDKSRIFALRKEMMDHLENEEGIKRSSASSELGQWHKTRAPF